jgi:hypothetical protein
MEQDVFAASGSIPLAQSVAESAPARSASWQNYVSGVDQAIEQFHEETLARPAPSPSASEASAISASPVSSRLSAQVDPSSHARAVFTSARSSFEPGDVFSFPATGIVSPHSGETASAFEVPGKRARAMPTQLNVQYPQKPPDARSTGNERTPGRSIALSIVLAAAVISPSALGQWLGSLANRRRARWTNQGQQ